jgi:ribosomal protein S18 acetylase RimI-like enzyme
MPPEILEKLTDFIQKYLPYADRDLLKKYLKEHSDYGTIDYAITEKQDIIGLVRYNMSEDGQTGFILDLVIHPDYRGQGIAKSFILKALKTFPKVKWLVFRRERKLRKEERKIALSEFLKHNNF